MDSRLSFMPLAPVQEQGQSWMLGYANEGDATMKVVGLRGDGSRRDGMHARSTGPLAARTLLMCAQIPSDPLH